MRLVCEFVCEFNEICKLKSKSNVIWNDSTIHRQQRVQWNELRMFSMRNMTECYAQYIFYIKSKLKCDFVGCCVSSIVLRLQTSRDTVMTRYGSRWRSMYHLTRHYLSFNTLKMCDGGANVSMTLQLIVKIWMKFNKKEKEEEEEGEEVVMWYDAHGPSPYSYWIDVKDSTTSNWSKNTHKWQT